jgi:putative addiction module killer protein
MGTVVGGWLCCCRLWWTLRARFTNGNAHVTIQCDVIELRGYIDERGHRPFGDWFERLDASAAAKVTIAMARMEKGNLSNAKSVGAGVHEYRIDFGPGIRIYFGRDGERLIILIAGGSKKRQNLDILFAQECWAEYKRRKRKEIC